MRILIVSQSFYPDDFKINDLIGEFAKNDNEITVLSGLGDYTTGKVHPNYRFFKNRTEMYNGCKIKRVRTISRRKGPIFRSLNYLSFAFFGSVWSFFSKNQFDLVYVYQPSPATMIIPGIVAAKRNKVKLLIYCLDIWPEAVKAMNIEETNPAFKWIHKLSRYAYNKGDFILVSSSSFMDYLHENNDVPFDKMAYLPQHAEDSLDLTSQPSADIPKKAVINLVFTGNIGYVQDVETIIKAVAKIESNTSYLIHIVGSGSNYDSCIALAKELQVNDKIVFYGRKPPEQMASFYEMADACLLTLKFDNQIGLTIPAKLQGYMAAGKPILAAIEGDAQKIIKEANCGICVPASDEIALANAIETFIALTKEERIILGQNSLEYYQTHFNKEKFVTATLNKMAQMTEEK